jgi:hypothetical protein
MAPRTGTARTDVSTALRRSTTDERALEEAVVRARMGLLLVGVKVVVDREKTL